MDRGRELSETSGTDAVLCDPAGVTQGKLPPGGGRPKPMDAHQLLGTGPRSLPERPVLDQPIRVLHPACASVVFHSARHWVVALGVQLDIEGANLVRVCDEI